MEERGISLTRKNYFALPASGEKFDLNNLSGGAAGQPAEGARKLALSAVLLVAPPVRVELNVDDDRDPGGYAKSPRTKVMSAPGQDQSSASTSADASVLIGVGVP